MKKSLKSNNIIFFIILIFLILFCVIIILKLRKKDTYNTLQYLTTSEPISKITEIGLCGTIDPIKRNNGLLQAISDRKFSWDPKITGIIRIKFLNFPYESDDENTDVVKTYEGETNDKNGNKIKWDPLEEELYDTDIIEAIQIIVKERYRPLINIPIKFVNSDMDAEIRIKFDLSDGTYSVVGTECLYILDQNEPTMNFATYSVGTILHEFGHAFGLLHEHQSPNGNTIKWNEPAIKDYYLGKPGWDEETIKENITNRFTIKDVKGTPFDPDSIMLYSYPASFTIGGTGTKKNERLSPFDVAYLVTILYPRGYDFVELNKYLREYYYDAYEEDYDFKDYTKYLLLNSK